MNWTPSKSIGDQFIYSALYDRAPLINCSASSTTSLPCPIELYTKCLRVVVVRAISREPSELARVSGLDTVWSVIGGKTLIILGLCAITITSDLLLQPPPHLQRRGHSTSPQIKSSAEDRRSFVHSWCDAIVLVRTFKWSHNDHRTVTIYLFILQKPSRGRSVGQSFELPAAHSSSKRSRIIYNFVLLLLDGDRSNRNGYR